MNLNFDSSITNNKIKWQTAKPFNHLITLILEQRLYMPPQKIKKIY